MLSILWSKDILERGLIWRVGDRKSIKIFKDKWIPTMQSKIGEPMGTWDKEATVNDLINQGVWNAELISTRFNPYVAGEILNIPIRPTGEGDTLFWRFDAKGKYMVRDGFRLQRGLFSPPEYQSEYPLESWWAFIWSLSVPPKVRLFWWSISHDCIPTNQNLFRYHVPISESCCLCNYPMDTTGHALLFCAAIKHLWKNTPFAHIIKGAIQTSTLEICMWLKKQLSKEEFENLAVHTWGVWKEKQNFIHGDRTKPMADNVSWSYAMICDFRRARKKEKINIQTELGKPEKKWMPPRSYNLKMNVDAIVNKDKNQYSVGGVIRDSQGRLLLAFGEQINQPLSVVHGELLAIREGIKLLYEKDLRDVQLASYSLLAVQAVTTNQENLSYIGSCVAEIRNQTQAPIISEFIHV